MPNIKSQIARVKTNEKAKAINNAKESRVRTLTKKFKLAMTAETATEQELTVMFRELISIIDAYSTDGVYHKNTASRKVANLSKAFDACKASKNA